MLAGLMFGLLQVKHDLAKLQLTSPVCTKEKEKIALSRRVEKHWRLIGYVASTLNSCISASQPEYKSDLLLVLKEYLCFQQNISLRSA